MFLFLANCAPATFDDLRLEGEAEIRKLTQELRSIESQEDLQKRVPRLRKHFNQIAELLVELKGFPKQEIEPSLAAEQLFTELARLYEMPNGREWIESAQREAIRALQNDFSKQ